MMLPTIGLILFSGGKLIVAYHNKDSELFYAIILIWIGIWSLQ